MQLYIIEWLSLNYCFFLLRSLISDTNLRFISYQLTKEDVNNFKLKKAFNYIEIIFGIITIFAIIIAIAINIIVPITVIAIIVVFIVIIRIIIFKISKNYPHLAYKTAYPYHFKGSLALHLLHISAYIMTSDYLNSIHCCNTFRLFYSPHFIILLIGYF